MDIKVKKGYYLLKGKNVKLGLFYSLDKSVTKVTDELDISVGQKGEESFNIQSPGEYEIKDAFVMALDKNGSSQYLVNMDGISVLLSSPEVSVTDQELDNIGSVDVLVLREGVEYNMDLVKFVNRFDPQVLLLRGSDVDEESIKKLFGVELAKEEKKIQFKSSDFVDEEYKLEVIILDEK